MLRCFFSFLSIGLALPAAYAFSRYRFIGDKHLFFWLLTNRMAPAAVFALPFFQLYSAVDLFASDSVRYSSDSSFADLFTTDSSAGRVTILDDRFPSVVQVKDSAIVARVVDSACWSAGSCDLPSFHGARCSAYRLMERMNVNARSRLM